MKIDFDHWKGNQIAEEIQNQQDLDRVLSILKALNPKFSQDGNQWCYVYGEMPEHYIAGFGDTPYEAMNNFVNNFCMQKAGEKRS